jgi:hypothetical protein
MDNFKQSLIDVFDFVIMGIGDVLNAIKTLARFIIVSVLVPMAGLMHNLNKKTTAKGIGEILNEAVVDQIAGGVALAHGVVLPATENQGPLAAALRKIAASPQLTPGPNPLAGLKSQFHKNLIENLLREGAESPESKELIRMAFPDLAHLSKEAVIDLKGRYEGLGRSPEEVAKYLQLQARVAGRGLLGGMFEGVEVANADRAMQGLAGGMFHAVEAVNIFNKSVKEITDRIRASGKSMELFTRTKEALAEGITPIEKFHTRMRHITELETGVTPGMMALGGAMGAFPNPALAAAAKAIGFTPEMAKFARNQAFEELRQAIGQGVEVRFPPAMMMGTSEAVETLNRAQFDSLTVEQEMAKALAVANEQRKQILERQDKLNDLLQKQFGGPPGRSPLDLFGINDV